MSDTDPISDSTPHKRRRLSDGLGKGWDSQNDSGEEFTAEDFETVATMPITSQKRKLQYTPAQLHSNIGSSSTSRPSSPLPHVTQPTQTLYNNSTQPTQRLSPRKPEPHTSDVLVSRSSPIAPTPPKQQPAPIKRAPFAKPGGGLLASAMAPPGTSFRRPMGVQSKPALPIDVESDAEDPPVYHSSDEETQGLSSNLKPTVFRRSARADSTPDGAGRIIKESPRPAAIPSVFSDLLKEFNYNSKPADDMASAYSTASRRPRPPPQSLPRQTGPAKALPVSNAVLYKSVSDIPDYVLRAKTQQLHDQLPWESVQRCFDALTKNKANLQDAAAWLTADEEKDADGEEDEADELSSASPVVKRGVAVAKVVPHKESYQSVRPTAKQEAKAPSQTIAEKYASTQAARRQSQPSAAAKDDSDEDVKPKRRLLQGRRPARSSPPPSSPPLKPPQPLQRLKKQNEVVTIADDSESDSGVGRDISEEPIVDQSTSYKRLLEFFNKCSVKDLEELSAQPEDVVTFLLDQRPFETLDAVRAVTQPTGAKSTKSKGKLIGEKIVNTCSEMWTGYDAVDELVEQCRSIAKPIQEALRGWGVAGDDGELHLMNLDEAHDSGIGTPASSCPSDDIPVPRKLNEARSRFLGQPETMDPQTTLKDYQLVGLNWLNLMWSQKTSCILADDMGLGKTCQVIAFLAHLQQKGVDGVHLVIVPGSTLENWLREFARFAPELNVVPYYGSQAERPELQYRIEQEFDTIDVVVTTYDMAVKPDDNKFLRKSVDPLVCVYDEAHALRNPQSDRYKQLTRIPARFRVLLTGTPLQNNLQELVAILAFIMPELFAEKREELEYIFKHKASTKDADHAALLSAERINRARSMMTPFILRRKKQQVLDLPTKHSRVEYCDMTPNQANYYADLLEDAQQFFASKGQEKKATGRASSNILMSLRKAAIHPLLARRIYDDNKIDKIVAVLLKHDEYAGNKPERVRDYLRGEHHQSFKGGDYGLHCFCADKSRPYLHKFALKKEPWMEAAKIARFRQLVSDFAANGDRVLVFSQFTTMMNILEAVLDSLRIRYMRLDGQTDMQIRQDTIDTFTKDESIPVFMLSTKAGGAGINLACANRVIIFDSGFNPQDDIQAENRAHRVGQTREVEVIRLVTRGTIEEQIHALGESKLALDERVAGEGATAAEEKQAEKSGEQMVEKMFLEKLQSKGTKKGDEPTSSVPKADLKNAFKNGLESVGLKVASKQARF